MRAPLALLACLLAAAPAAAQDLPRACFARDYTPEHLRAHPAQNVAALRLDFRRATEETGGVPVVHVLAGLADQGRARMQGMGGRWLTQTAYCWAEADGWRCGVECDGGVLRIARLRGDTLDVSTDFFLVGQVGDCGGAFDLAERPGSVTTYRLTRAPAAACEGG